jgi:hypothetical protein
VSPFQAVKTWKTSTDPDYEAKKNRVLELYAIADGKVDPGPDDPAVVICMDEFGPLNLQPHPGRQWAPAAVGTGDTGRPRRRRRRATYLRPHGIRHLLAGYDLSTDRLYGHVKVRKTRIEFLAFCRYLRSLHPPGVRMAIVLDNFSPHLSTKTDNRVGEWAAANNVELAQPDRGPVHRPALLRPRRHRPPQPPRAGQHDPPLHRLAKPARHRPRAPQGHPPSRDHQTGEGCLTRH